MAHTSSWKLIPVVFPECCGGHFFLSSGRRPGGFCPEFRRRPSQSRELRRRRLVLSRSPSPPSSAVQATRLPSAALICPRLGREATSFAESMRPFSRAVEGEATAAEFSQAAAAHRRTGVSSGQFRSVPPARSCRRFFRSIPSAHAFRVAASAATIRGHDSRPPATAVAGSPGRPESLVPYAHSHVRTALAVAYRYVYDAPCRRVEASGEWQMAIRGNSGTFLGRHGILFTALLTFPAVRPERIPEDQANRK